mgnify:CR=1 FL=1
MHFTLKQHPMTLWICRTSFSAITRTTGMSATRPGVRKPRGPLAPLHDRGILARDKTSLDIFWIKDKSLADLDNLPAPEELAQDIMENLQSAMDGFSELLETLKKS